MKPSLKRSGLNQEKWIFLVVSLLCLVLLVAGFWLGFWVWLTATFILSVYIIWWVVRLVRFYRWFKQDDLRLSPPKVFGLLISPLQRLVKERQQAERIQNNNKELIQQFRTMVEALPYATVLLNKALTIKYLNERAEQMFGLSQSDVGKSLQQVFGQSKVMSLFDHHIFTPEKAAKDGLKMPQPTAPDRLIKTRLIDVNRYRYLLLAHDVSAMEALQKSRKNFMANASHELRTPLTVITGYLEFLQNNSSDSPQVSRAIQQAYEQSQRMAQIIADMLSLSRIEHDSVMATDEEMIDMPLLLNRLFNDVKHSADARQHIFNAQIDSQLLLKGSRSEITGICLNLLHNAVLHTDPGTQIQLRWFLQSGQACLMVKDNGSGIAAKHLPHVTERFYRVAKSAKQKQVSTGLGLAIVKHIGIKHGAELIIDSQRNQGSCFTMKFPVNRTKHKG
ncbi:phosphate regulon sensor protein PhoR [Marinicella gelatinilytica]|uniref:phosphate regulon sensor protein PhoR n=1 Tax=Marinicella gelatinilytica TaxID=2996017 RepID=UPI002260CE95|nr:phosphate regulon sensor protein PhoR [Marinicella gelatinilytica]MCX7545733.1 phosphate regulon sensor protein PhoR [Marinicella gelatinilytica]